MNFYRGLISLLALFVTSTAFAGGDGKIAIFNYHENEYTEIIYQNNGKIVPDAIKQIEKIFRSRGGGATHVINPRLLELLDTIQDHFGAQTIELISGYRSPTYNRSLKMEGREVASESLHMQGLAADIHLDEVTEEDIFNYAKSLGIGGVGIYPRYGFVHVDVGPPRAWQEANAKDRILIGTENNPNPVWSAITDRNNYMRDEELEVLITNNDYKDQRLIKNIWLEHFSKGQWGEQKQLTDKPDSKPLVPNGQINFKWQIPSDAIFGKYRLVIFANKDFSVPPAYSNEFYIKKK